MAISLRDIIKYGLAQLGDLPALGADVVYTGTWAGRPAASSVPVGSRARITDVGTSGSSEWVATATRWVRDSDLVIYNNGAINATSTSATETQVLDVTVKGGLLGPNGVFELRLGIECTNNANNKTPRLRIGTAFAGSTEMWVHNFTTTGYMATAVVGLQNKTNTAAQIATTAAYSSTGGTYSGTTPVATIDTENDFHAYVSFVTNGTDSMTLKRAIARIYN